MKFAHSLGWLNGYSTLFDIEQNIWFSALSVHYIHSFGHKIDLYATKEYKFLMDIIDYDNFVEIQNDETIPSHVYSKFKMIALRDMPLDTIHIDNDVMIEKKTAFDLISTSNADMTIQYAYFCDNATNNDSVSCNNELINSILYLMSCGILNKFPEDLTSMIGGLYKFTNQELKDKIINNYFDFYHNNAYIINSVHCDNVLDNYGEEYQNYHIAVDNGYTVKSLCPMRSITDTSDLYDYYDDCIGFHHYYGLKGKYYHNIKYELNTVNFVAFNRVNEFLKGSANRFICSMTK